MQNFLVLLLLFKWLNEGSIVLPVVMKRIISFIFHILFCPSFVISYLLLVCFEPVSFYVLCRTLGHAVAQLVGALSYNPQGHGFDS